MTSDGVPSTTNSSTAGRASVPARCTTSTIAAARCTTSPDPFRHSPERLLMTTPNPRVPNPFGGRRTAHATPADHPGRRPGRRWDLAARRCCRRAAATTKGRRTRPAPRRAPRRRIVARWGRRELVVLRELARLHRPDRGRRARHGRPVRRGHRRRHAVHRVVQRQQRILRQDPAGARQRRHDRPRHHRADVMAGRPPHPVGLGRQAPARPDPERGEPAGRPRQADLGPHRRILAPVADGLRRHRLQPRRHRPRAHLDRRPVRPRVQAARSACSPRCATRWASSCCRWASTSRR